MYGGVRGGRNADKGEMPGNYHWRPAAKGAIRPRINIEICMKIIVQIDPARHLGGTWG